MTIQNTHHLNELNKQYQYIQKIYFLKCKELSDIENNLTDIKEQIKQFVKYSRPKLKHTKNNLYDSYKTTEIN